jgi:hypothetical protein
LTSLKQRNFAVRKQRMVSKGSSENAKWTIVAETSAKAKKNVSSRTRADHVS